MRRFTFVTALGLIVLSMTAGCLPTQTIIVRFEDLKSDFFALESTLQTGDWAKFDWNTMTITISSQNVPVSQKPVALGAFQVAQAHTATTATPAAASAERPDIDLKTIETTDTIIQLMRRRQARLATVMDLKKRGVVGEGNDGMLRLPSAATPPTPLDEDTRKIVDAENVDRLALLMEVLRQRQFGADRLVRVAQTFAQVQRDISPRGVWVQFEDNVWEQIK